MSKLVTLKSNVKPANLVILSAGANTAHEMGIEITITSGNDSTHHPNSKHYSYEAIDFRSHDMTKEVYEKFIQKMQDRLGSNYTILHEDVGGPNQHIHVQIKKTN